jgi:hypothetical protein
MGLLDGLKSIFGTRAGADATREADPEDLFGMSTAYISMEADLDYRPSDEAALCFGEVDSTDFQSAVDDVEAILRAGETETGTTATFTEDDHGYRWIVLHDRDFEDLVTSIHFAADTLVENGYGSRLLAAVFAFEQVRSGDPAYWVYSFRRGAYYPFCPDPDAGHERDSQAEFKLDANLSGELSVEDDTAYWYPLWPDTPGEHPWE